MLHKIDWISPVIITKNAEKHLEEVLESLQPFSHIVLYDNGSEDRTLEIAAKFDNVHLHQGAFEGFGPTKNRAVSLAPTDWVFSLDADEVPDKKLLEAIRQIDTQRIDRLYRINRQNYFIGKQVRHSGWSPDRLIRIYNRHFTTFSSTPVHESVQIPSGAVIQTLDGSIKHYAVDKVEDLLIKVGRYSTMRRLNMKKLPPILIFSRALFAFFRTYVLKLGFLDGVRGLTIAVSNFNGVFFKYMHFYFGKSDR